MKYLKTYEGLFDVFKSKEKLSDEKIVKDYIDKFDQQDLNMDVIHTSTGNYVYFTIGELCVIKYTTYKDRVAVHYTVEVTGDDNVNRTLDSSKSLNSELFKQLGNINTRTNEFIIDLSNSLHKSVIEIKERIIEFDVIKNYDIDNISLSSLFDFYNISENISEGMFAWVKKNPVANDIIKQYSDNNQFDLNLSKSYSIYVELYKFTYNNNEVEISRLTYQADDIEYSLSINGVKSKTNYEDFLKIRKIHSNTFGLISGVNYEIFKTTNIDNEIIDRCKEFEVVINGQIDWINLNQVFDYYNIEFNIKYFKETLERHISVKLIDNDSYLSLNEGIMDSIRKFMSTDSESKWDKDKNVIIELTNKYSKQRYNFDLVKTGYYYQLDNLRFEWDEAQYEFLIYLDGKKLVCSADYTTPLENAIAKIQYMNNKLVNILSLSLSISKEEALDRILEFELIKDYKIDEISLESLYDYYDIDDEIKNAEIRYLLNSLNKKFDNYRKPETGL